MKGSVNGQTHFSHSRSVVRSFFVVRTHGVVLAQFVFVMLPDRRPLSHFCMEKVREPNFQSDSG